MTILTDNVRELLSVDASRSERTRSIARVVPPAAAIVNALVFASFEHSIRNDPSGHALALFLLLEMVLLLALNASYFGSRTSIILAKTRIFPLSPPERFRLALAIELRRRIVIALAISNAGCLALFLARSPSLAGIAVGLYLLTALGVELTTVTTSLLLLRTPHPPAYALALGGLLVAALAVGLMVFDIGELLDGIPFVNWCAGGIVAAHGNRFGAVLQNGGILAAAGAAAAIIGTKWS